MCLRPQRALRYGLIGATLAASLAATLPALSQSIPAPPSDPNQRTAYLVRQNSSDCSGADVANENSPNVAGNIVVTRLTDGNTSARVAINAKPATTYHLFLRCVNEVGQITTDDEGVGNATISIPSSQLGSAFSFDLFQKAAPAGDRFHSSRITFQ